MLLFNCVSRRHLFLFYGEESKVGNPIIKNVVVNRSLILACQISTGTDELLQYTWTRDKRDLQKDSRFSILIWGGLFIRNVRKDDKGTYNCVAKTFDPPMITLIKRRIIAREGRNILLPCSSKGNPSKITTKWSLNGKNPLKSFGTNLHLNGTLVIRKISSQNEGVYKCTPFNEIGAGNSAETFVLVAAKPKFTRIPPKTLTVKLGGTFMLICNATIPHIIWRKINESLPESRTTVSGSHFSIHDVRIEDSGTYECQIGTLRYAPRTTVEVLVESTPVPPIITMVKNVSKSVAVSWKSGYNGGTPQTLEIWYRLTNTDDYHWQIMKNIPDHVTSYEIDDIDNQNSYIFSMRGLNNLGSGVFSPIFCSKNRLFEGYGKDSAPLPPREVICTRKLNGYKISWQHD
ncbi:protein turtle homolog A-like, partial [Xenia sp. Carnegie-2017]|uniref:protein turtle homolog A-like n=1 Tax=Xenia sp. Carnegie-2017 TaxID=2897299 RepID=UPI001F034B23